MITDLTLRQQTKMILLFNGIYTVEQLKKITLHQAKQIKGLGRKGINDIVNALSKNGGCKNEKK